LKTNPLVALFFVVTIPVCLVLIRLFREKIATRTREFRVEIESMSARINDMIEMIPVTRARGSKQRAPRSAPATVPTDPMIAQSAKGVLEDTQSRQNLHRVAEIEEDWKQEDQWAEGWPRRQEQDAQPNAEDRAHGGDFHFRLFLVAGKGQEVEEGDADEQLDSKDNRKGEGVRIGGLDAERDQVAHAEQGESTDDEAGQVQGVPERTAPNPHEGHDDGCEGSQGVAENRKDARREECEVGLCFRDRVTADGSGQRHGDGDANRETDVEERRRSHPTDADAGERAGTEKRRRKQPAEQVVDAECRIAPPGGGPPGKPPRTNCGGRQCAGPEG